MPAVTSYYSYCFLWTPSPERLASNALLVAGTDGMGIAAHCQAPEALIWGGLCAYF